MVLNVMRDDASPPLGCEDGLRTHSFEDETAVSLCPTSTDGNSCDIGERRKAVHFVVSSAISCENIAVESKVIEASR